MTWKMSGVCLLLGLLLLLGTIAEGKTKREYEKEERMKAFFEEMTFDDVPFNEALIQLGKREGLGAEIRTAQSDGDSFNDGKPKMSAALSKEWVQHKMKEDQVNSWREQNHLPPVRMVNHNGVDYNVAVQRHPSAVTKAKESMTPEAFELWMQNYLAEGAANREKISKAREQQFRWGKGMENFKTIQRRIAELEQIIATRVY